VLLLVSKLNLRDFASEECEKIKSDVWFPPLFGKMVGSKQYKQYCQMPESIRSQVCDALNPELSLFYPEDQPWILRNLTMQEYVRSQVIGLKPEYIHGPNIDFLGFGEVIFSRVYWSTSPSVAMPYEGGIHRGVWAGEGLSGTGVWEWYMIGWGGWVLERDFFQLRCYRGR
jgi:hypothetical protein